MKMTNHITYVRVEFPELYQWGRGWTASDDIRDWDRAWKENLHYGWKLIPSGDGCSSSMLVSLQTSIYLHPMNFTAVIHSCGCMINGSYNDSEVEDLYDMCKKVADHFNTTFIFKASKEKEIEFDLEDYAKPEV